MATDKSNNEIVDAWQTFIEQSVKANTSFLEESAKLFTDLLSNKTDTKDLLKINTAALNAAVNNFIKLNVSNSQNLMNFGVTLSRNFFSLTDTKTNTDDSSATDEKPAGPSPASRNEINLSVKQGEQITTSFYLNSHNAFAQNGKFYYGNFIGDVSGDTTGLSMLISPKEFMLEPAKSLKVDISINAAAAVTAGKYKSTVRLDGMDNQEFDIIVDVAEQLPAVTKISRIVVPPVKNVAPPVKNKVVKNTPRKKTKGKK